MNTVFIHEIYTAFGGQPLASPGNPVIPSPVQRTERDIPYLTAPGVVVLARPQVSVAGMQDFLADYSPDFAGYLNDDDAPLSDGAHLCKVAGQLCYLSFGPRRTRNAEARRYFENLKALGHGSVFEHATFSLLLYGVSRSVTHELVRHRHFAFSQVSQRYVTGQTLRFVERPEYQADKVLHAIFVERINDVAHRHARMVSSLERRQQSRDIALLQGDARTDLRKKVQQAARSLLPNETEAPIVVTGNVRAWRHFIEMRASAHAEIEIRALAIRVFACLALCEPLLFEDYQVETLADGTLAVQTPYLHI